MSPLYSPSGGGDRRGIPFPECERLRRALLDCHRRVPEGPPRQAACRHLNQSLAECLVSLACPYESEAVRSLCSSGGTALKRRQCQQAQMGAFLGAVGEYASC